MEVRRTALAIALLAACAAPAHAQDAKVDETRLALDFLRGRFRMPVTCTRADGTIVHREEAVVFRPGSVRGGEPAVRATFFGIDAPDADRCYNLVEQGIPDRRGVLFVTYRAHLREDLGAADFRRKLREGELLYHVTGGKLVIRPVGRPDAERTEIEFERSGARLHVETIPQGSDGDKLLDFYQQQGNRGGRRFHLRVEGPDEFGLSGFYLEDASR